jgi:hypothetical protein
MTALLQLACYLWIRVVFVVKLEVGDMERVSGEGSCESGRGELERELFLGTTLWRRARIEL